MGCNNYWQHKPGPCANCGREHGAITGDSAWGHKGYCCGNACGKRLAQRIQSGMAEAPAGIFDNFDHNQDRVNCLRLEIKLLRHRLKQQRRKPTSEGGRDE